ncbi:hypothetical protein [Persephonella sp.]
MFSFKIGYKIEIFPGDNTLVDIFQPMITFEFKDIKREYVDLSQFFDDFERFSNLYFEKVDDFRINRYRVIFDLQLKSLFNIFDKKLQMPEYIEYSNCNSSLKGFQVFYDEEGNIKNIEIKNKLEGKLKESVKSIYKNIFPLQGEEFAILLTDKEFVLMVLYDEIGVKDEFEISFPERLGLNRVNFLDLLEALKTIYSIKKFPEALEKYHMEIKKLLKSFK